MITRTFIAGINECATDIRNLPYCYFYLVKIVSGALVTTTVQVVLFSAYSSSPTLLQFLNASWKSCFLLRFCIDHLNYVNMAVFQFYLQSGKQKKVAWGQVCGIYCFVCQGRIISEQFSWCQRK
jgi:hypothetical protein